MDHFLNKAFAAGFAFNVSLEDAEVLQEFNSWLAGRMVKRTRSGFLQPCHHRRPFPIIVISYLWLWNIDGRVY